MDGPPPGETQFDDLNNYDVGDEDDPFSDNYKPPNKKDTENPASMLANRNGAGLGIDEEIEVSKKIRAPRVKLDEHRYNLFLFIHLSVHPCSSKPC
jgi:replication fork protection complex subunit Csm3/Swi3